MNNAIDIIIDPEFKSLIPALSEDERSGLEASIISEGCRDRLSLWGDTLIDGHNRYSICCAHGIQYETIQIQGISSREDAKLWIIDNQLSRRNITAFVRGELALSAKALLAERAKERQAAGGGDKKSEVYKKSLEANLPQAIETIKPREPQTRNELAAKAGVSGRTIDKIERIKQTAGPALLSSVRSGDVSIHAAVGIAALPPEKQGDAIAEIVSGEKKRSPHVSNNSGENEWYTPSEYIEAARSMMGSIDLDPASCEVANKTVRAGMYYSIEDDGLLKDWRGNVWLNPPYSSDLVGKFADKVTQGGYNQAIVLVNNATETKWFQAMAVKSGAICFPSSRVRFNRPDGSVGAPLQGQAVLYFGDNIGLFNEVFREFGVVLCSPKT